MRKFLTKLLLCTTLALGLGVNAWAQASQPDQGTPSFFTSKALSPYETINLATLNVDVNAPIRSKTGPIQSNFSYSFSSNVYVNGSPQWYSTATTLWNPFALQIPVTISNGLSNKLISTTLTLNCTVGGGTTTRTSYIGVQDGNGTTHYFTTPLVTDPRNCLGEATSQGSHTADDTGFYSIVQWDGTAWTSWTYNNNGALLGENALGCAGLSIGCNLGQVDTFGNQVYDSVTSYTHSWKDELSTNNIVSYPDPLKTSTGQPQPAGTPLVVSYTDQGGATKTTKVNWVSGNQKTAFGCYDSTISQPSYAPANVTFADFSTLAFTWHTTPAGDWDGLIKTVKLPTGGTATYDYSGGTNNTGVWCAWGGQLFTNSSYMATVTRTTPSGAVWKFERTQGTYPASTTKVTDPNGNYTIYQFSSNFETQRDSYAAAGTLLDTVKTCYQGTTVRTPPIANCAFPPAGGPGWAQFTMVATFHYVPGVAQPSAVATYYDLNSGLKTKVAAYDFVDPNTGSPTSTTSYVLGSWNGSSCVPMTNTQIARTCSAKTTDINGNIMSYSLFSYDLNTGVLLSSKKVTAMSGNTITASLTGLFSYDANGAVKTATDVNGSVTTNLNTSCNNLLPTTVTTGSLVSSHVWDCNGGVSTKDTDPNGNFVLSAYADPFWRNTSYTDELGNVQTTVYNSVTRSTNTLSFNGGASVASTVTTLDNEGREKVSQTQQGPGSTLYDTISRTFNNMGQVNTVSVPCSAGLGGTCATAAKTFLYDPLGRTAKSTDVNGGTVTTTYTKNDVETILGPAPSGESVKSKLVEFNGLGQPVSVCEETSTLPGNLPCGQAVARNGYLTTMSYFASGLPFQTIQGPNTANPRQSYKSYDVAGRVTATTTPETGTTELKYDSDPANGCTGTYLGDLASVRDANANVTCFSYDLLHRKVSITYPFSLWSVNDAGSNTAQKGLIYDQTTVNGQAISNSKGGLSEQYTIQNEISNSNFNYGNYWLPTGTGVTFANNRMSASNTNAAYATSVDTVANMWKPIATGQQLNISGWLQRTVGTGLIYYSVQFVTAAHANISWTSCTATGLTGSQGLNTWTFVNSTVTAPANTAYYQVVAGIHGCSDADHTLTTGSFRSPSTYIVGKKTTDEYFSYSKRGELLDLWQTTPHATTPMHSVVSYWSNGALHTYNDAVSGTTTYLLDGEGRPYSVSGKINSVTYSPAGPPLVVTYALNGATDTYTYDGLNHMKTYSFLSSGVTVSGTMVWNANGSLKTQQYVDGFTPANNVTCTYASDDVLRIKSVSCPSLWSQNFAYDQFNNISETGNISFQPTYDNFNRQGPSEVFNNAGEMIYNGSDTSYNWNADHKSTDVSTTAPLSVHLTYDASGTMVEKEVNGVYSVAQVSPLGVMGYRSSTGALIWNKLSLPGVVSKTIPGFTLFQHADWLGNVRLTTKNSGGTEYAGNLYSPFGANFGTSVGNDPSFTGQTQDSEPGVYDFDLRKFFPNQGRWRSPDPAEGNPLNPQSLNRYAYAMNMPMYLVDRTGGNPDPQPTSNFGPGCYICSNATMSWSNTSWFTYLNGTTNYGNDEFVTDYPQGESLFSGSGGFDFNASGMSSNELQNSIANTRDPNDTIFDLFLSSLGQISNFDHGMSGVANPILEVGPIMGAFEGGNGIRIAMEQSDWEAVAEKVMNGKNISARSAGATHLSNLLHGDMNGNHYVTMLEDMAWGKGPLKGNAQAALQSYTHGECIQLTIMKDDALYEYTMKQGWRYSEGLGMPGAYYKANGLYYGAFPKSRLNRVK